MTSDYQTTWKYLQQRNTFQFLRLLLRSGSELSSPLLAVSLVVNFRVWVSLGEFEFTLLCYLEIVLPKY